jgi:hypothetical protein
MTMERTPLDQTQPSTDATDSEQEWVFETDFLIHPGEIRRFEVRTDVPRFFSGFVTSNDSLLIHDARILGREVYVKDVGADEDPNANEWAGIGEMINPGQVLVLRLKNLGTSPARYRGYVR